MVPKEKNQEKFYGITTVGEKGQTVIPVEARRAMKLKRGEKLLVFGMGFDIIALTKLSQVEKLASHLAGKLKDIQRVIKKANSRKN